MPPSHKAKSVLTEEQIKKTGEVPDKPVAMLEMWRKMSDKMMLRMGERLAGKDKPQRSETEQDK